MLKLFNLKRVNNLFKAQFTLKYKKTATKTTTISNETNKNKSSLSSNKDFYLEKPDSPLTCCGSGCQNCVYLTYADDLMKYYEQKYDDSSFGINKALEEVNKITDESLKSYITMEIQMKYKR